MWYQSADCKTRQDFADYSTRVKTLPGHLTTRVISVVPQQRRPREKRKVDGIPLLPRTEWKGLRVQELVSDRKREAAASRVRVAGKMSEVALDKHTAPQSDQPEEKERAQSRMGTGISDVMPYRKPAMGVVENKGGPDSLANLGSTSKMTGSQQFIRIPLKCVAYLELEAR
ncbi:hypothetical protein J6590_048223 [Homalodisca vitripennis]|nr:hypothetical protein J6590_048223 [Homalodisca vitripennis]